MGKRIQSKLNNFSFFNLRNYWWGHFNQNLILNSVLLHFSNWKKTLFLFLEQPFLKKIFVPVWSKESKLIYTSHPFLPKGPFLSCLLTLPPPKKKASYLNDIHGPRCRRWRCCLPHPIRPIQWRFSQRHRPRTAGFADVSSSTCQ